MTFVHHVEVKDHMKTTLGSAGLKLPEQLAVLLFCLLPAGPAGHAVGSNSEPAEPAEPVVHLNLLPAGPAVHLNLLPAETAAWLCPQQPEL